MRQQVHKLTRRHYRYQKKGQRVVRISMQQNTRYISIQLGIGGWQPFDATEVAKQRIWGLQGIVKLYVQSFERSEVSARITPLIHAGENETYMTDDFPYNQFNHVILFVPLPKDTDMVECTDQTLPAGYLSAFTADQLCPCCGRDWW